MNDQILRVGTRSVLVDLPDLDEVMAWHATLTAHPLPGQVEVIAAAKTVLVNLASRRDAQAAFQALQSFVPQPHNPQDSRHHTIGVIYDGEDLASTAELMGISSEELITRHTEQKWLAAFGGFAPGFTYCVPSADDTRGYTWDTPRRDSPRTAVPAGAVGLAGQFSAVYPRTSPGGWQLLGHTDTPMWDASSTDSPALLQPGDTLNYSAVRESVEITRPEQESSTRTSSVAVARPAFTVTDAGLQTLFQDSGRRGCGDIGVNHSGAVDRASAWTANDVVGNPSRSVVLENIGGLTLTAAIDVAVCVTGAQATVSVDGRRHQLATPVFVRAGQELSIEPESTPGSGLRNYLAVRGGFSAETVLDSASTDILSGLGPDPITTGERLSIGRQTAINSVGSAMENPLVTDGVLRVVAGPRDDWFAEGELERFCSTEWIVTGQSNRVGLRLALPEATQDGTGGVGEQPLTRAKDEELASEGMVGGSIQVPPNGLPVVFLADHPVTGGYPVIATVIDADLDAAGQLAPGDTVRFTLVDPTDTLA